jgi:hypothetical protein
VIWTGNPAPAEAIGCKFAGLEKLPVLPIENVLLFNDFESLEALCKQIIFPVNILLKKKII